MKKILIRIFKNVYFITWIIAFVLMLILGIWMGFSWSETLLASAALSTVGVVVQWWQREVW